MDHFAVRGGGIALRDGDILYMYLVCVHMAVDWIRLDGELVLVSFVAHVLRQQAFLASHGIRCAFLDHPCGCLNVLCSNSPQCHAAIGHTSANRSASGWQTMLQLAISLILKPNPLIFTHYSEGFLKVKYCHVFRL